MLFIDGAIHSNSNTGVVLDRIDSEILVNRLGQAPEMCNSADEFGKHPRKGVYSEQNSLLIQ